jgi:LytR cell envelope-related transcriptional attenuator
VVLVLAVVAAAGLATWMLFRSTGSDTAGPTPTPTATTATSGSPSPSPTGTKEPSKRPSASPSPTRTRTDRPTQQPVPDVGVYVFNQTSVTGLAATFAASLEAEGWRVLGVDNWRGYVPENTVYYWPGDKAAAERLSDDFADIGRVWPATSPMPRDGLVVILASPTQK